MDERLDSTAGQMVKYIFFSLIMSSIEKAQPGNVPCISDHLQAQLLQCLDRKQLRGGVVPIIKTGKGRETKRQRKVEGLKRGGLP